ncbi:GTPase Era [Desulfohalovibrio reitneri]|uniref:GTPase Era n=1 Tax=Desulfohalovibrio reitneri TaxID=1307759 RepID=UPI0004A6BA21|nr:GTPase Era [Desulfohalovibrio reitneri]
MSKRFGTITLMGPPNAGKSTLLNHALGEKLAIVTPKPQTTRNQITGILTTAEAQVLFLDTPGVHRLKGEMNRFLLRSAWEAMNQGDVILLMLDAKRYVDKPRLFEQETQPLAEVLQSPPAPLFVAANKIDRVHDKRQLLALLARINETWPQAEVFPVSALTGDGVDEMLEHAVKLLPEGDFLFPEDQLSTLPLRFMAQEIIREKLFLELRHELPYSTAVEIESWEEEDPNFTRIHAVIYVARQTHKGMVIGKGGQRLKQIGQLAREEIGQLTGTKVHLELWVKVQPDWTENPSFLRSLGLGE